MKHIHHLAIVGFLIFFSFPLSAKETSTRSLLRAKPPQITKEEQAAYLKIVEQRQGNRHVIGSRNFGFFSNFFGVLVNINWCLKEKKIPVIFWDAKFPYYQSEGYNGSKNAWEYYFYPVSNQSCHLGDIIDRGYCAPDNSYIVWWDYDAMLKFREFFSQMIAKYIHVKEPILNKVDLFYEKNMKGKKTIGIHLRGTDKHTESPPVPLSKFIEQAKSYPKEYQFYVATDENQLLKKIKKALKGYKVISYPAYRSDDAEPIHYKNIPNKAVLGEEILIEALLLSKCDLFIHAHSNVALAVLYFNADLKNVLL